MVSVKVVCDRLYELLRSQGGGCVDAAGTEVFPFDDRVNPSSGVETLRVASGVREVRGAVWRLTHGHPFTAVWAIIDGDALHVGTLTDNPLSVTEPVHSLEGLTHG